MIKYFIFSRTGSPSVLNISAKKLQQPVARSEKSSKQKAREIFRVASLGLTLAVGGYLLTSSIVGQHKLAKNVKIILSKIGEKKKQALKKILHKFSLDQKVALTLDQRLGA